MNLNPEELKELALSVRRGQVKPQDGEIKKPLFQQSDVDHNINQLEQHVKEFAANGHLSVDYLFKELPPELRTAVAKAFKARNPRLFVMELAGQNKITVTWDGNNYV